MTSPSHLLPLRICFRSLFRPPFPAILLWSPRFSWFPSIPSTSAPAEPLHNRLPPPYLSPGVNSTAQTQTPRHFRCKLTVKLLTYPHIYTSLMFPFLARFFPPSPLVQIREGRTDGIHKHTHTRLRAYTRFLCILFELWVFHFRSTSFQPYEMMGSVPHMFSTPSISLCSPFRLDMFSYLPAFPSVPIPRLSPLPSLCSAQQMHRTGKQSPTPNNGNQTRYALTVVIFRASLSSVLRVCSFVASCSFSTPGSLDRLMHRLMTLVLMH